MQQLEKNRNVIFISLLLIFNFVIRALFLGSNPLDLDEPYSVFFAQMNIGELIKAMREGNNPPFYEIMLHFWMRIAGSSAFSVRFPSLVFSVINVWFVYRIAMRFLNTRTAVVATLLISFSANHLYFSHEARVYALFMMLTTMSFYYFFLVLDNKTTIKNLIFLFLIYTVLAYSHYFAILIILLQGTIVLSMQSVTKKTIIRYLVIVAALILAYLPNIPVLYSRAFDSVVRGTWVPPADNLGPMFYVLKVFSNNDRLCMLICLIILWTATWKFVRNEDQNRVLKNVVLFLIIPVYFLVSYSIYFDIPFLWHLTSLKPFIYFFSLSILAYFIYTCFRNRTHIRVPVVLSAWFIIPFCLLFTVSFFVPVFINRYMLIVLPAFFLVLTISIDYLFTEKWPFQFVSALVIICFAATFNPNEHNNRYSDKIAANVSEIKNPGSKIIISPFSYRLVFALHYCPDCFKDYNNLEKRLQQIDVSIVTDSTELSAEYAISDHVIFVDANSKALFPNNGIYEWLEQRYTLENSTVYRDSSAVFSFRKEITPESSLPSLQ